MMLLVNQRIHVPLFVSVRVTRRVTCVCMSRGTRRNARLTIDDPGGHRARLDHAYNKTSFLTQEEIQHIMFRRTNHVYDIDLSENTGVFQIFARPRFQDQIDEHEVESRRAHKIKKIIATIRDWNMTHTIKDILESLDGPLIETQSFQLFTIGRLTEFHG